MTSPNTSRSLVTINTTEESQSFEGDDIFSWKKLLRHLNDFYLDALHAIFKEKCYTVDLKKTNLGNGLNKEEFVKAIVEVFGDSKYTSESIEIFNKIDEDKGKITWEEFLDFAENQLRPRIDVKLVIGEPKILPTPHLKRETINKIVCLETEKYFSYALVSKNGCVGLYDGNLNFLLSYTAIMSRDDITRTDEERRRKNRWITDAVFAPNEQMFIISNSARSLTIYDASNLHHIALWLIMGSPCILTCLHFRESKSKPTLYAGNEYGEIITFEFQQSDSCLFRKKHNDKMSMFYWVELRNEKEYVIIKNSGKIHDESINDITYYEDIHTMLTCSRDSNKSLILSTKIQQYVFKMRKGANCCYLSYKLKLILTGSEDGSIKIWNIFVTKHPVQTVRLHKSGIVDVAVLENQSVSLSCSRDGVIVLLDLKEFVSLQTLTINFPAFGELGKIIEWGKNSLCPGPKRFPIHEKFKENDVWERTNILVTCCNNLVSLDLHFLDGKTRNFELSVLPPPPLQNSVLIPVNWKVPEEKRETKCEITECDEKVLDYIESLNFILDKDLLENGRNDINLKISQLESKKLQMKDAVAQGAPYLALDLPSITELELSPNLPIPENKKTRRLVEKTQRLLSAASSRSAIFSSASPSSSSRTRSNRSSVIEFD